MIKEDYRAKEIKELYDRWSNAREDWDTAAREDIDFYLGNHFSEAEAEELASRNQSAVPMDRLYSAIEQFKAIITSKPPKFTAVAREDSDSKLSSVWRVILEYIWDNSDGNEQFKQAVHDYAVTGLGYFYAYIDKEADYGRGEIKFKHLNPFKVYVDPNSRHMYFDDASGIMVSHIMSKMQLLDAYPQLAQPYEEDSDKMLIDYIDTESDEDYPSHQNRRTMDSFTPDVVKDYDYKNSSEKYRLMEYYTKTRVPYYRLLDKRVNQERIVAQEQFEKLSQDKDFLNAIDKGFIDFVEVQQTRIRQVLVLGQIVLSDLVLDTDIYPVVPVPNIWTNTPYPMSDVRKNKDFQRFLNKVVSLITSHAQASSGLKLLIPQGSVQDIEELERDWANPNATLEYDASFGEPHFPSPQPLSSSIMQLPGLIEKYIDLNMGIFEMMQGNAEVAPRTSSATMMMEDFGQRRSKSKLRDIEGSLKRIGRVVYNLSKSHYDFQKTFRIAQPNNDINEYTVNKRMYDDKTKELMTIENDVSVGQFDIRVIGNSTMPSNKWAEWEIYMQAYQSGLIDKVEALKKTDIFDKEGVLSRADQIQQLQQALAGAQNQIKKVSGDLQTAHREAIQARKRTEVEKFKTELNRDAATSKAESKLTMDRLKDAVKLESEKLRIGSQAQLRQEKSQKEKK
tara:strand:- start:12996 stop:15026 length:2031 start_codon:yes stop_codon:yes gene_type:complete